MCNNAECSLWEVLHLFSGFNIFDTALYLLDGRAIRKNCKNLQPPFLTVEVS